MSQGLQSDGFATSTSVDPVVLILLLAAFAIGAIGPFALSILGSYRDERSRRAEGLSSATEPETEITHTSALDAMVLTDAPAMLEPPANDADATPAAQTGGT